VFSFAVLRFLPDIERINGPVITHHPRPDFTFLPLISGQLDCFFHEFFALIH